MTLTPEVTEFDLRPSINRTIVITEPDFGLSVTLGIEQGPRFTFITWSKIDPALCEFLEILQREQGFAAYTLNSFLTKYWADVIEVALKKGEEEKK